MCTTQIFSPCPTQIIKIYEQQQKPSEAIKFQFMRHSPIAKFNDSERYEVKLIIVSHGALRTLYEENGKQMLIKLLPIN